MINIDKFKKFVYFAANKNGRGTITPAQFNLVTEQALNAWTNKQIGDIDQAASKTSLDLDQVSMEKLRHLKEHRFFKVENGLLLTPNGIDVYDLNTDLAPAYWFFSALSHRITYNDTDGNLVNHLKEINIIKDSELAVLTSSQINYPTHKHPVAVLRAKDFELYPSSIHRAKLDYIREPLTPEWKYTMVSERPVYDSANSIDVDAPPKAFIEISMIALEYMGIHIRENELIQFAAMQENTAQ